MNRNLLRKTAVTAAALLALAGSLTAAHLTGRALFGVTFFGNELIEVNPTTGAARSIGSLGATVSPYGLATRDGRLYTFDPNIDRIREINRTNGKIVRDINILVPDLQGEGDLAFRPSDGVGFLFTALNANAEPVNDLYTFDINTGTSVRLGSTGLALDALAFKTDGTLYGLSQGDATLYTINTTTGAATKVGDLGVMVGSPIAGMAFAPANPQGVEELYAAIDDRLHIINTTNGAATPVSQDVLNLGFSSVSGLAFAPASATAANISSRVAVGTGENAGIGGFIVRGTPAKRVIIRGVGPSLTTVQGRLEDPALQLFNAQGQVIASNNDWRESQQAAIQDSGLAPQNDKESAIIQTLNAGAYTAILRGNGDTTGVGLVEIYDLELGSGSRLANLSTRGQVQTGENVLIGGVLIRGAGTQRAVLRAIGPTLANSGVQNPLQDPTLELVDSNGNSIATNDNWRSSQEAEITATGLAPADDRESAIVRDLTPGDYTAIVRGAGDSTGIGLVEFYSLAQTNP